MLFVGAASNNLSHLPYNFPVIPTRACASYKSVLEHPFSAHFIKPSSKCWSLRDKHSTMPSLVRLVSSILISAWILPLPIYAVPSAADPCTKIAGKTFVVPADAMACQKAFPFNETLRQNVLTNIARVFDFFTFENYYLNSPPPFQESTTNIRATLARINTTKYQVSEHRLPSRNSLNLLADRL